MYTFGVVVSAIALAPVAVVIAAIIVAVMAFNFVVRELMLATWDLAASAISELEVLYNDLVSEKDITVVTAKEAK